MGWFWPLYQRTGNNCTIHCSSKDNMKYEKSWVREKNNLNNLRDAKSKNACFQFILTSTNMDHL